MREPVDVSALVALRSMQQPGQPDAVARIATRFLEETPERLDGLRQAIEKDDALGLERAAHAMKGIAGTVGANEMLDLAVELEHIGRQGNIGGAAEVLIALESAWTRARPIFDRLSQAA